MPEITTRAALVARHVSTTALPGFILLGGFAVNEVITGSGGGVGGELTLMVTCAVTVARNAGETWRNRHRIGVQGLVDDTGGLALTNAHRDGGTNREPRHWPLHRHANGGSIRTHRVLRSQGVCGTLRGRHVDLSIRS